MPKKMTHVEKDAYMKQLEENLATAENTVIAKDTEISTLREELLLARHTAQRTQAQSKMIPPTGKIVKCGNCSKGKVERFHRHSDVRACYSGREVDIYVRDPDTAELVCVPA